MTEIFPIGDFHIHAKGEVVAFTNYINQRPEKLLILLGDVIHFAHSFWSSDIAKMEKKKVALKEGLKKDFNLWKNFFRQLRKQTILYYGTHEMAVTEACLSEGWTPPPNPSEINENIIVPLDCEEIKLPDNTYVTGLHVPQNTYSKNNPKFGVRKNAVEKYLENKLRKFIPKKPEKTIFCTHEPTDYYYKYMGYKSLTEFLKNIPFRVHYHAHIHSNLREDIVGITPTVNRSFQALRKFKSEVLNPLPEHFSTNIYSGQ